MSKELVTVLCLKRTQLGRLISQLPNKNSEESKYI